uniref:40S ribosomal protein S21 n=1 Tax=Molossus molossus TaxID=27622 RepID=A0A7J8DT92_MOLMO|nr:hypothetical protein HJG59_009151 [Molossus molossus]
MDQRVTDSIPSQGHVPGLQVQSLAPPCGSILYSSLPAGALVMVAAGGPWTCRAAPAGSRTCPATEMFCQQPHHPAQDPASVQMNVAEVDKVAGGFNGQFKTYAVCRAICRMGESEDSILRLAKADGIVPKN